MKIDHLPAEMLMRIFGYLPTYKKVSLVSHKFYNVACAMNDKNMTLSLDARNLLWQADLSLLQSIQETYRLISNVDIRGHSHRYHLYFKNEIEKEKAKEFKAKEIGTVISILKKFSETIKYLRFDELKMDVDSFVRILSLVPNAEQLVFKNLSECGTANKQLVMSSNEDLKFEHLKTLAIYDCDEVFQVIFNRLPAGILTELRLDCKKLLHSNDLFKRQSNIKTLDLFYSKVNPNIFYNMKLESLKCLCFCGTNVVTALSRQTKLKSLKLGIVYPNEHLMEYLAPELTELEELEWHVAETPVHDIVNIRQLTNLKHLTLNLCDRLDIFDAFCELNNLRITSLEIMPIRSQSTDQIRKLATSLPLLKVLKASDVEKWEKMSAILKYFNFVEGLHFEYLDEELKQDEICWNESDSVNPNLTELIINFPTVRIFNSTLIQKLISVYPNLKMLDVDVASALITHSSATFRLILEGFTKLESLKLYRIEGLAIDDFKYLRDRKTNLKFVSLRFRNGDNFIEQHKEELTAMFEVVTINSFNNHVEIKNL